MLTTAAQSSPRLFCSQTSASFPLQIQVSSDHSLVSHSTKEREKKKRKSKRARKSKSEKLRLKKKSQTYTIPEVSSLKTRKAISVQFSIENSETKETELWWETKWVEMMKWDCVKVIFFWSQRVKDCTTERDWWGRFQVQGFGFVFWDPNLRVWFFILFLFYYISRFVFLLFLFKTHLDLNSCDFL